MHTLEQSADSKRGLLEEAISVVCGDRNNAYGPPSQDFQRTADMLNAAWDHKLSSPLESHDVAILMVILKLSRLQWSPERRDSWVDIAGYAACGWQCIEDAEAEEQETRLELLALLRKATEFEEEQPEPHCTAGPEYCGACADEQRPDEELDAETPDELTGPAPAQVREDDLEPTAEDRAVLAAQREARRASSR